MTVKQPEGMTLSPTQASAALETCVRARQPVILWSPPGLGKSSITAQLAATLGVSLIDIRGAQLDAVDLRGLPSVAEGITRWNTPAMWPTEGAGIVFLDELNRSATSVQNGLLQLCLDRRIGDYVLPPDWTVIAACNPDGAGTTRISPALSNRFVHLTVTADLDAWCAWAIGANVDPIVIGFLRFRPELLHAYDPKTNAYPTPRSWEFVSRLTQQCQPDPEIELALIAGTVGHGAAVEFSAFARLYRSLPNLDAILLNPDSADVPTDPATLYATASALSHRVTDANLGRALRYLERLPGDFATFALKAATRRDPALAHCPEFTRFVIANPDAF
jgi:hypothetical protein